MTTPKQTIEEVQEKIRLIIGKQFELPITKNKGLPGLLLEELTGIPQSSDCLDAENGELKTFPLKKLKNGKIVPKETIAVTMMCATALRENDFRTSRVFKKLSRTLYVPILREGDQIQYKTPKIIDLNDYPELVDILEADYNAIRANFLETGIFKSEIGTLLQCRTKGPGHGSISRAFYLRPEFVKKYIPLD
jgi:hypothetical protein